MDLEKPSPLSALDASPEPVPAKTSGIAESGETYLETILALLSLPLRALPMLKRSSSVIVYLLISCATF